MANARTEDQRRADFLSEVDDEQLICRAGHRHRFPSDEITSKTKTVPRGLRVSKKHGVSQVTELCMRNCGVERLWETVVNGWERESKFTYNRTKPWPVNPRNPDEHVDLSADDWRDEQHRRAAPIFEAAARAGA